MDITRSGEATFVAAQGLVLPSGAAADDLATTALANRPAHQVVPTAGDPLVLTNDEVLSEKEILRGGVFYVARCSEHFAYHCMVTSIPLREAWRSNEPLVEGFFLLGSLTGISLGLMMLLEPRKRSLPTQLRRALLAPT